MGATRRNGSIASCLVEVLKCTEIWSHLISVPGHESGLEGHGLPDRAHPRVVDGRQRLGGRRLRGELVQEVGQEEKLLRLGQGLAQALAPADAVLAHGGVGLVLAWKRERERIGKVPEVILPV